MGKKDARFVFNKVNSSTGLTAAKIRKSIETKKITPLTKLTPLEGLAFLLNQNLTKAQYKAMRLLSKVKGADIWPSYHNVLAAKIDSRPKDVDVTDHSAVVPLQQLLNHTASQILENNQNIEKEMIQLASKNNNELSSTLIFKLGFDGSGSYQRQMQPDSQGDLPDVKNLVATQLVPLQLDANMSSGVKKLWASQCPNSAHACRPVRLSFEKENDENVKNEYQRLQVEIQNLKKFEVCQIPLITISFVGLFTLVDGKIVCILTNGNTSRYSVCDASGAEMGRNVGPFNPISPERLQFGISPLHFMLRSFELLLHIAYKQDLKEFRPCGPEKKKIKDLRELKVKKAFMTELGLAVDQPRPGGIGNTNTGNVARKALENAVTTAQICGVSPMLVSNLNTIHKIISSPFEIDCQAFESFCQDTLEIYFADAGW
jgi:hypothetical protein